MDIRSWENSRDGYSDGLNKILEQKRTYFPGIDISNNFIFVVGNSIR